MPKRKTVPKAKESAWGWFSKYIRIRDCVETTGSKEYGKCFTCDKVYPFKSLQAGHFIDGRGASILFEEDLVHAQCYACNVMKSGNKDAYTPKMIQKHGLKKVKEFWAQKNETHRWSVDELEYIENVYKERYEEILNEKGVIGRR